MADERNKTVEGKSSSVVVALSMSVIIATAIVLATVMLVILSSFFLSPLFGLFYTNKNNSTFKSLLPVPLFMSTTSPNLKS